MQKFVKTIHFQNDDRWLARHGMECWDAICAMPIGEWFMTRDVDWARRDEQAVREVRLTIANVIAEYESQGRPDCPIERVGNRYRLTANRPS
ncbi:MAG: hypothetical protein KF810_13125 [Rhizobiaceae bacterium]|nr:hypothetical protein [Rhizobiaceae bacterium]